MAYSGVYKVINIRHRKEGLSLLINEQTGKIYFETNQAPKEHIDNLDAFKLIDSELEDTRADVKLLRDSIMKLYNLQDNTLHHALKVAKHIEGNPINRDIMTALLETLIATTDNDA